MPWTRRSYDAVFKWSAGGAERRLAEKIMLADKLTDEVDRLRKIKNLGEWYKITQEAAASVGSSVIEKSAIQAEKDLEKITRAASAMGKKGGSVRSPQKTAAVRENGRKGGRPRKKVPTP